MARPRKYIDRKLLKDLAQAQLTNAEIARCLRVSSDTIERRYAVVINAWRKLGTGSARRRLFTLGMRDDPVLDKNGEVVGHRAASVPSLIFFLKNYGGMADVTRESREELGFGNIPIAKEFRPESRSVN